MKQVLQLRPPPQVNFVHIRRTQRRFGGLASRARQVRRSCYEESAGGRLSFGS